MLALPLALTLVLAYIVTFGNCGGGGVTDSQATVSYTFTSMDTAADAWCGLSINAQTVSALILSPMPQVRDHSSEDQEIYPRSNIDLTVL